MTLLSLTLVLLFAAPTAFTAAPSAPGPMKLDSAQTDSLNKFMAKDRSETELWLKSAENSYLATVQRRDFEERTSLTIGSAATADVRIDDPEIKPQHLRVTVVGDSFRVE